ncbi:hypothetical protein ELE36_07140 [Pseudolysobacter antarcticus]|uniref:Type II toxin-antitoxin system HicB family antitoxin n=1 Tax=Pseudolysobacter antarcticus TaxID=2511995 RepID=A0A411HI12_9GAMM|nr:hypothetical protein [Pseudolysobacter antarcticus]QBB70156.1 hypothetical protein ELE36_07140 [Pseudolysobacter antarcticus]
MEYMRVRRIPAIFGYDATADQFRGRFLGLSEQIFFKASTLPSLRAEAAKALDKFLSECVAKRVTPYGQREEYASAFMKVLQ